MNVEAAILNVSMLWLLTAPHEFAHAWVATRLGDDTPRLEGRVTLNPLAHVDWLGTLILPALMSLMGSGFIGWGKPVNTNPAKLRGGWNGVAIVAMAGPASNVVFAVILGVIAAIASRVAPGVAMYAARAVNLSLYLAIFNMIPVPPLDGSKLLLAARVPVFIYRELANFGFVLILLAMSLTSLGAWMSSWSWDTTRAIFHWFA